jgi:molybdopterin molybdotransferase
MVTLEQARETILAAIGAITATEILPIALTVGRAAMSEIIAPLDLPPFDNAAVDGYAVHSADLASAAESHPVALQQTGSVAAGEAPNRVLTRGTCMRILTGAVLPAGADAVVMQEDTARVDPGMIRFSAPIAAWEGIRLAGEDLRRGTRIIPAGERLRPAHVGLLAATGHATLTVRRRPRIALLATGNELLDPQEAPAPGRIYDSNRPLLSALAMTEGAQVVSTAKVPDTLEGTMTALRDAARLSDVVVTTGGVSVGDADRVKAAMLALGGTLDIWRIAMRPGKPFAWGHIEDAWWFGLPGNPVSAFVTWWLLVRPSLRRLMGMSEVHGRRMKARMAEPVANRSDRRHFIRVYLDEKGEVRPTGTQASHIQSSLAAANALLDVPPMTSIEAGSEVKVELLE